MKKLFGFAPYHLDAIAIIRVIVGLYMMKYGFQVFDAAQQKGMGEWLGGQMHFPAPLLMAYLAKGAEFFGGFLFVFGLWTRLSSIFLVFTMIIATFIANKGDVLEHGQVSFLFLLLTAMFFFTGPGRWSLDYVVNSRKPAA